MYVLARVCVCDVRSSSSYVLLFMYVYMFIYVCEWNSGDNPLLLPCEFQDLTEAFRLGIRYLLSHLARTPLWILRQVLSLNLKLTH